MTFSSLSVWTFIVSFQFRYYKTPFLLLSKAPCHNHCLLTFWAIINILFSTGSTFTCYNTYKCQFRKNIANLTTLSRHILFLCTLQHLSTWKHSDYLLWNEWWHFLLPIYPKPIHTSSSSPLEWPTLRSPKTCILLKPMINSVFILFDLKKH